jgi:hypothetical protein
MRFCVTVSGGWVDSSVARSRGGSRGYRESSAGSGGHRVCNCCTWACFACVWRPASHAMCRACSLAVQPGHVTFGRCGLDPPSPRLCGRLESTVPSSLTVSDAVVCYRRTDAGGWPRTTAIRSRSQGYRESSAGSGGQRVCIGCTWACFTCVRRPASHAIYRACCLAVKSGCFPL